MFICPRLQEHFLKSENHAKEFWKSVGDTVHHVLALKEKKH